MDTAGVSHTVWSGQDPSAPGTPVNFRIDFVATDFAVAGVTVHVDTDHNSDTWEEIDAVALHGVPGDSLDCNTNGVPDECEDDCNANGVPDDCDVAAGTSEDCNANGLPDDCDVDADSNGVPDDCEDEVPPLPDCNSNGLDDALDLAGGTALDCNSNDVPDSCDIAAATSADCDTNGVPDECQTDVDTDDLIDACDRCPNSDMAETIVLNGCDSGVANLLLGDDGCTMADQLAECENEARNHGAFVSCVAHLTNAWKSDGVITGQEKGRVQRCAAHKPR